jgi:tetratricopeptide (TPR) repeat protein
MKHRMGWLAAALLAIAIAPGAVLAAGGAIGGGGGAGPSGPSDSRSPEKLAVKSYHKGVRYMERAVETEKKLASASEADREALHEKAERQYVAALRKFDSSVSSNPDYYKAHSDKGFVLRRLGRWDEALAAYDRALAIESDYGPAIEYRAEAYLELGRLDEAKAAYLQLYESERELADLLMGKMREWVARRRADPKGIDPDAIESFAEWVAERGAMAARTTGTGGRRARTW